MLKMLKLIIQKNVIWNQNRNMFPNRHLVAMWRKQKQNKRVVTSPEKEKQALANKMSPKKHAKGIIAKMVSPHKLPVSTTHNSMALESNTRQYDLEKSMVKKRICCIPGINHWSIGYELQIQWWIVWKLLLSFQWTCILNEQDVEVPLHMTWMDGVDGKDSLDENERDCYGLKILFILMCSPRAKDKELKYLDDFISSPDFSLESIASMSVLEIAEKLQKLEFKTRMHIIFNKLFRR